MMASRFLNYGPFLLLNRFYHLNHCHEHLIKICYHLLLFSFFVVVVVVVVVVAAAAVVVVAVFFDVFVVTVPTCLIKDKAT